MHVLVTAGISRLGEALVRSFCKNGHQVTFTFFTSSKKAEELANQTGAKALHLDLTKVSPKSLKQIFELQEPPINAIVNNSSIFEYDKPTELSFELLDSCYSVNLRAALALLEAFLKHPLKVQKIAINVLDSKIEAPNPDYASYTIMKQALAGATKLYAMQTIHDNIKVYGIAPAMFAESGPLTKGKVSELSSINPLSHSLSETDIVNGINFLLSGVPQSGEILLIDGGQTLMNLPRDVAYLNQSKNKL